MTDDSDATAALDAVLAAFADHLAAGTARPMLDHLDDDDRRTAGELMRLMESARGIDPSASAPSLEALLAGTEFADALPPPGPVAPDVTAIDRLRDVLVAVDPRVEVGARPDGMVSFVYLDLRAWFCSVDGGEPTLDRGRLRALFDADVDLDVIGIVAGATPELLTRLVSRYDVDPTVFTATASSEPPPVVLPATLAARRLLEDSAPEWDSAGLDDAAFDDIDVSSLQVHLARDLLAAEARRPYRGDKALAYRSLVDHGNQIVELVAKATRPGGMSVDLAAEVDRIARRVA
jgi:hypothetical protein